MRVLADKFIELLKWPVAVFMLLSLPAYVQSISYFPFFTVRYLSLIAGFFCFFISWGMMDKEIKTNMEIAAHEMTHAFFALLTFHKVKGLRVNPDNSGGEMAFEGSGNWLIIIAPYFFPLFGFVVMLAIGFFVNLGEQGVNHYIANGVLGFFIGYHMDTVGSQIHEKQTDLPKVSYKFCIMFLPSANLWALGSMLAFNSRGWDGFWLYQGLIKMLNDRNLAYAKALIGQFF